MPRAKSVLDILQSLQMAFDLLMMREQKASEVLAKVSMKNKR